MGQSNGSLQEKPVQVDQTCVSSETFDWKGFEQKLQDGQTRLEETLKWIEEFQHVPQELLNLEVSV